MNPTIEIFELVVVASIIATAVIYLLRRFARRPVACGAAASCAACGGAKSMPNMQTPLVRLTPLRHKGAHVRVSS